MCVASARSMHGVDTCICVSYDICYMLYIMSAVCSEQSFVDGMYATVVKYVMHKKSLVIHWYARVCTATCLNSIYICAFSIISRAHTQVCIFTRTYIHDHKHTQTYTHTYTHIYTYIYVHIRMLIPPTVALAARRARIGDLVATSHL